MVPLHVERLGDAQNVARAIYHAELASLASIFDYYDLALAYLDVLLVQRRSPVFHIAKSLVPGLGPMGLVFG
jgi:hypothetical protein